MGLAARIEPSVEEFVTAPLRRMLIDGKWVEAASGKTFDTLDPATGEVLARVAEGDAEDVDRAVRAARRRSTPARGRAWRQPSGRAILLKLADLIEAARDRAGAARDARQRQVARRRARASTSRRPPRPSATTPAG